MSRPVEDGDTPIFDKLAAERGYNSMIVKTTSYDPSVVNLPYLDDATVVFGKIETDEGSSEDDTVIFRFDETPTEPIEVHPLWEKQEE